MTLWTLSSDIHSQLDRLTGGGAFAVVSEIKQKAQGGDLASVQVLGQLAILNCRLARSAGSVDSYKNRQITEAQALSPNYIRAAMAGETRPIRHAG